MTYERKPPQRKPITPTFRPPLAFKLMTTPQHKRWWSRWMAHRNYCERLGHPLKMVAPSAFHIEVQALENRILELEAEKLETALDGLEAALLGTVSLLSGLRSELNPDA